MDPVQLVEDVGKVDLSGYSVIYGPPGGGYQLTKRPTEINLAEIIYSIDRAPTPSSALSGLPPSSVVQAIRLVWQEVSRKEQELLSRANFAQMVDLARKPDESMYYI